MKIVKRILQCLGFITGIIFLYLSIITFVLKFEIPEQPLEQGMLFTKTEDTRPSQTQKYVSFEVKGPSLRAWLYLPENLSVPVLLQVSDYYDSMIPRSAAEETEKELGKYAEVKHYAIGHFDIYFGNNFEKSVIDQLDFFKRIFDI